ncbi:MAG: hypothetical protein OEW45_19440 [Deltaproteobacteria bacterium]|nr:hypothetical protein [Deltaproteobacteria bacterium]
MTGAIGGNLHRKDSVVGPGPSQYALEASAGIPPVKLNPLNLRRGRREASSPPLHEEITALWFQADRTGSRARPIGALGIYA